MKFAVNLQGPLLWEGWQLPLWPWPPRSRLVWQQPRPGFWSPSWQTPRQPVWQQHSSDTWAAGCHSAARCGFLTCRRRASAAIHWAVLSPVFPPWRSDPLPSAWLLFSSWRQIFRGPPSAGRQGRAGLWNPSDTPGQTDFISCLPQGPIAASGFVVSGVDVWVPGKSEQWREVATECLVLALSLDGPPDLLELWFSLL